jgi:hypothetical protein
LLNTNSAFGRPLRILRLLAELDGGLGDLFILFQGQDTSEALQKLIDSCTKETSDR